MLTNWCKKKGRASTGTQQEKPRPTPILVVLEKFPENPAVVVDFGSISEKVSKWKVLVFTLRLVGKPRRVRPVPTDMPDQFTVSGGKWA